MFNEKKLRACKGKSNHLYAAILLIEKLWYGFRQVLLNAYTFFWITEGSKTCAKATVLKKLFASHF